MFKKILFSTVVFGLAAAVLHAGTYTISGRMGGNLPAFDFEDSWSVTVDSVQTDYDIDVEIYPDMAPMQGPGYFQTPGYYAKWETCYGRDLAYNNPARSWTCIKVSGLLPTRTTAITQLSPHAYAVNIDISMLTEPVVTVYCSGSGCPPSTPQPTTWPLIGTFTMIPAGTPNSSRVSLTGQISMEYYEEFGSYSMSFSGSMLQTNAIFAGTAGLVPPMAAPPAPSEGDSNANITFYKGMMQIKETYTEPPV